MATKARPLNKPVIYKFPLADKVEQVIEMPLVEKVLSVQLQGGVPCLWALVWPQHEQTKSKLRVQMVGTGWDDVDVVPDQYISTIVYPGGLVFHFFAGLV